MAKQGWEILLADVPSYGKAKPYRIPAYSEMMPAHDTHDNMSNIDLDYGAAVAAIAIESVARAAQAETPAIQFRKADAR